jgi:hypothetical protein
MSPNKQLVAEVMTVIILGSATFVAMSSERPVAKPVANSTGQPQDPVRDPADR